MSNVPSENILKLIELTDKLCLDDEDRMVIAKLKEIIEYGKAEVLKARTIKGKIKCYESMCQTITNVLNNIQII
jgi:hypothetical protein